LGLGVVFLAQVAAYTVQFVRYKVELDVVWFVGFPGIKAGTRVGAVISSHDLEAGGAEGGVAGGVGGEGGLEGQFVAVGGRGAETEPEGVAVVVAAVAADAGQRTPVLEVVFLAPGEDASIGHGSICESEEACEICIVGFVRDIGFWFVGHSDATQDLVVETRWCADEVGTIVCPEVASGGLGRAAFCRWEVGCSTHTDDVVKCVVVLSCLVRCLSLAWRVGDVVVILDCDALGSLTVDWGVSWSLD